MGTDNVELLDRRTAELVIRGTEADLATLVDSRWVKRMEDPPVWREHWDAASESFIPFPRGTATMERLRRMLASGATLTEIKSGLLRHLCVSSWLYLDYWGCAAEVFGPGGEPPGGMAWEEFVAPMYRRQPPQPAVHRVDGTEWVETSGRQLLTSANTEAMIRSLRKHQHELMVMREQDVDTLERWHRFCLKHDSYCLVYQVDF